MRWNTCRNDDRTASVNAMTHQIVHVFNDPKGESPMKRTHLPFIVLGFLVAWCLAAQVPNSGMAMKIVEARKTNAALMKQYTWNCRTELIRDGKVMDIRIDQVQYGPDGNLQRVELNNESFSHPHGFFRKMIADDKKKELEKYLKGLRELLDQYTLPSAGKVIDFMSAATVDFASAPDGSQLLKMQGSSVVIPGDTLAIWANASNNKMRKIQISTTYENGPANVTATFKTKPNGLTHMSLAEVELPDKNISLMIHNYDYEQND
jgi:hypothetical protein